MYFFVRRGRENLYQMTTDWFAVKIDPSTNTKYIEQVKDELDKNYSPKDTTISNKGKMYENPGQFPKISKG